MLFILIMDVLNNLFIKAGTLGLLHPLSNQNQDQLISLYADDVALFIRPVEQEMNITWELSTSWERHPAYIPTYKKVVLFQSDVIKAIWRQYLRLSLAHKLHFRAHI
jgi:hypothetical protein